MELVPWSIAATSGSVRLPREEEEEVILPIARAGKLLTNNRQPVHFIFRAIAHDAAR